MFAKSEEALSVGNGASFKLLKRMSDEHGQRKKRMAGDPQ